VTPLMVAAVSKNLRAFNFSGLGSLIVVCDVITSLRKFGEE